MTLASLPEERPVREIDKAPMVALPADCRTELRTQRVGVIALVPDRWHGIWMPRHQVSHRLSRHFEVVWVEAARHWREYWWGGPAEEIIQDVAPDAVHCTIYDPGRRFPEIHRPVWLRNFLRRGRVRAAERILRNRGCSQIVLYLWRPEFAWALDAIQPDLSCYHIDDEYTFATSERPNDPCEIALIRRVDQVFVHSRALLKKKGGINHHTFSVPNGVDYAAYSTLTARPADLAAIPQPRMGYVGVLKAQLDFELLSEIARRQPQWSFVAVGPQGFLGSKLPQLERWAKLPNVHLFGNRAVSELPAYVQGMDVCLMPYEINDYTNFIYPLKLHEYLASGRPVVARPIDALTAFADVVGLADTVGDWEKALAAALTADSNSPEAVEARRKRALEHDWNFLVDRIAEHIRQGVTRKSDAGAGGA